MPDSRNQRSKPKAITAARPLWLDRVRYAKFVVGQQIKSLKRDTILANRMCGLTEAAASLFSGLGLNAAFCQYGKGNHENARKLLSQHGPNVRRPYRVHKALWLAGFLNDVELCDRLMRSWKHNGVRVKAVTDRLYAGLRGETDDWFIGYRDAHRQKLLDAYFPNKSVPRDERDAVLDSDKRILLLTSHGPGDEISFAKILTAMREDPAVSMDRISMTCDIRLHSLMRRSFPEIDFIGVHKVREIGADGTTWRDYRNLPFYGLHVIMDHAVTDRLQEFDHMMFVPDFLYRYRNFVYRDDRAYLFADPAKIVECRAQLPNDKYLVGLNWRSMIVNSGRDADYLTIEQLAPVFELPDVTFVNLQYGEAGGELDWVEERYPGKLITLPGLDLTNDFDGVAALMMNLDLIVAPSTTVTGVAGALARPILLLCNSLNSINGCRQPDGRDVWFGSVRHIVSEPAGDKARLVARLCDEIAACVRGATAVSKDTPSELDVVSQN